MSRVLMTTGLLSLCCAAHLSAATASTADPGVPFHDVLVGVGMVAAPDVTEHQTPSGGATTDIEWEGGRSAGYRFTVTSLNGRGYRWGGIVWGAELALTSCNITPETVRMAESPGGSVKEFKTDTDTRSYRAIGGNLILGYEYGIMKRDGLRAFVEVLPYIGGGFAQAETVTNAGTVSAPDYRSDKGRGRYGEYGIRVAGFVTERNWMYGIQAGVARSIARVNVDLPGVESQLDLKSTGLTAGVLVGYRF